MVARWYVVHVHSGFEKKVVQAIELKSKERGMSDLIEEILIPTQQVIEVRRGVKAHAERKFFPGYVLIKMEMNDDIWHVVKSQPKVTGFLGSSGRPVPVGEEEVSRIMKQIEEDVESPKPLVSFEIGEQVRVCDGPFNSFNGFVEEIDGERSRLKVAVSIFGRATPVELEYSQVEKI